MTPSDVVTTLHCCPFQTFLAQATWTFPLTCQLICLFAFEIVTGMGNIDPRPTSKGIGKRIVAVFRHVWLRLLGPLPCHGCPHLDPHRLQG